MGCGSSAQQLPQELRDKQNTKLKSIQVLIGSVQDKSASIISPYSQRSLEVPSCQLQQSSEYEQVSSRRNLGQHAPPMKQSSEFSFAESPVNRSSALLKFNQLRKVFFFYFLFYQNIDDDCSRRNKTTEEEIRKISKDEIEVLIKPLIIPLEFTYMKTLNTLKEESPGFGELTPKELVSEIKPAEQVLRLNLLDIIKQVNKDESQQNVLRQQLRDNPKIDLICLLQERMKKLATIQLDDEPSPIYQDQLIQLNSLSSPFHLTERQSISDKQDNSPIYFIKNKEKSCSPISFLNKNDKHLSYHFNRPKSIDTDLYPPTSTLMPSKCLKPTQNTGVYDSLSQNSFIVQQDTSRLDLDKYTLRIDSMDVSYQQDQLLHGSGSSTPIDKSNIKDISMDKRSELIHSERGRLMKFTNQLHPDQQQHQLLSIRSMDCGSKQSISQFNSSANFPIETSLLEKSRDEEGNKKINNYIILRELGRGGFGKVMLAYVKEKNQYFAVKVANKCKLKKKFLTRLKSAFTLLEQEIAVLKQIDHPNTVKLLEVIDDPDYDKLYLIMEFIPKGAINSKAYWKHERVDVKWDEGEKPPLIAMERLRKYTRDFLQGLDYLHNYTRIIHRDIKPDNLLIDATDTLKIADFGVAHIMDDDTDEIIGETGTKAFLPPEILQGKQGIKGKATDIWAFGVTLFILSYGYPPFFGKSLQQLKENVYNTEPVYPTQVHPLQADFIKSCLIKDPRRRAILDNLIDHDWVTSCGEFPLMEQDFDQGGLVVSDFQLKNAFTKCKLRATVKITASFNSELKKSRLRLQSRTLLTDV